MTDIPSSPIPGRRSVLEIINSDVYKGRSLNGALARLYAFLVPACLVVCATNGFDGSLLNGLQAVPSWQTTFHHPKGALLGFMSASYPLGAILSTPFSAPISDRLGRRWSILIGSIIMIVGVVMQTAAHAFPLFVVGRIVVGFGITLALTAGPVLISELAHPRDRVLFTSLYNTSYYFGALIAAWITYGTYAMKSQWAWRLPTLFQAGPAVLQILFIWLLPESPRWLIYKDRGQEALEILIKYHGNGDVNDELAQAEFAEINLTLSHEKEVRSKGLKLFIASPGNRRRLLILVTLGIAGQWSGNGLVTYYLSKILTSIGITGSGHQTLINGAITTTNYATALIAAAMTTRIGRRYMFIGGGTFMWLCFVALTTCIAVYATTHSTAAGHAALGFIFIYYTAYNITLNPLFYLYPSEILPFRMRAMGFSILVFTNKCALFFNQFVNPIGLDALGWKYYLVYVGWILVEIGIFFFFYPETLGHTLEQSGDIFDDMDSEQLAHSLAFDGPTDIREKDTNVDMIEKSV
ncbi:general substrate transporter [Stipitochalara longipes BDJ]|nr:general substrate transporter [Stipitochalara longipes BDJ]